MKTQEYITTQNLGKHLITPFFSKGLNGKNDSNFMFFSKSTVNIQRQGEELTQVWRVGPLDAIRARRDANTASQAARDSGLPGLHNGPADAYRHAYWNCLMIRSIGVDQAQTVSDTHEEFGANHPNEQRMDLHNNQKGREAGQQDGDCHQLIMSMLRSGDLQIIPNYERVRTAGEPPQAPAPSNTEPIPSDTATSTGPYTYGNSGYGGYQ